MTFYICEVHNFSSIYKINLLEIDTLQLPTLYLGLGGWVLI